LKVALVHDWLTGMRGGEKVLLALARLFPEAPVFTLLHHQGRLHAEIEKREIHTSPLDRLPRVERYYRHLLPLFPWAVSTFDLRGFDLVFSSSHCVAKAARKSPGALHVCYCHTPMRYIWDRYDDYFGPGRIAWPARVLIGWIAKRLRTWDVATAAGVDHFLANSRFVAERIARHYRRQAAVIPPPIDTDFFTPGDAPDALQYDLIVSALVPYKRIDLALEAYRGSGRRLVIVGTGPEQSRLRRMAPSEADFKGSVSDLALRDLYRGCRVLILPSVEDAGMTPLEAMACGRPAVVFAEGGAREALPPGEQDRLVFHEARAAALRAMIDSLETMRFNTSDLRRHAETFAPAVFARRITTYLDEARSARTK
jgi:glycosyltransferase involved in cell wall biosynthesis